MDREEFTARAESIRSAVEDAAARAGRSGREIQIVAVSKNKSVGEIELAIQCGFHIFGENYADEICEKFPRVSGSFSLHFIGQLQRNKVKYIIDKVSAVQSVDRLSLAQELNRRAASLPQGINVLVQVNSGREERKAGVDPGQAADFVAEMKAFTHLNVRGLMVVAPYFEDIQRVRPLYRQMGELYLRIKDRQGPGFSLLSMGMSRDYAVAVEEGANMVRIGEALFGKRSIE